MTVEHTPGPWHAGDHGAVVVTQRPHVATEFDQVEVDWYGGYVVAESICERDMPLISAAPDLLAACEAVMRVAETCSLPGPVHLSITERDALAAAVRKARGEEPRALLVVGDAR